MIQGGLSWCSRILKGTPVVLNIKGHPNCNPFTQPARNPDSKLLHITQVADRVLKDLHDTVPLPARPQLRQPEAIGPAHAPPAPHLPAEAPGPIQNQIAQSNPEAVIKAQLDALTEQISRLSTLQMLNKLVHSDSEQAPISELMRIAGDPENSPWKIFSGKAWGTSWLPSWNWFRCGFYYHLTYTTSLIPNAVKTCLESLVDQIQTHLTTGQNSAKHLDELVEILLENIDGFLIDYSSGTIRFANANGPQENIHFFRDLSIEERYNKQLEALCLKFSKKIVQKLPKIPFFEEGRSTPYLGTFLSPFFNWAEEKLNNYLRKKLQETIFPNLFKALAMEGKKVDRQKDSRLLLKQTLAEFFLGQLKNLQTRLFNPPRRPREPRSFHPPHKLADVVKKLKAVLDLEAYTDQTVLKIKLQEKEAAIRGRSSEESQDFDAQVEQAVEQGIHTVCHFILQHVREPENTNQILSQLLTVCNAPFRRGHVPTNLQEWRALEDRVDTTSRDLKRIALDVFRKIVSDNVNDLLRGISPEKEALTEKAFQNQKEAAQTLFYPEIAELTTQMVRKVEAGEDILPQIGAFAKAMRAFGDRERILQDDLDRLDPSYKESLQRTAGPIFEQVRVLVDHLENLKKWQILAAAQSIVVDKLTQMQRALQTDLTENPEALETLAQSCEAITKQYPEGQPEAQQLKEMLILLRRCTKQTLKQKKILEVLRTLKIGSHARQASLANLLHNFQTNRQRNSLIDTEFEWSDQREKLFDAEEKERLRALLSVEPPPSPPSVSRSLEPLERQYTQTFEESQTELDRQQRQLVEFVRTSLTVCTQVQREKTAHLRTTVCKVQTLTQEQIRKVTELSREPILQTTPAALSAFGFGGAGFFASLLTLPISPLATISTSGLLAGVGHQLPGVVHWWKLGEKISLPLLKIGLAAATGLAATRGLANSLDPSPVFTIAIGTFLPASIAYFGGKKITTSSARKAEEKVLPAVMSAFDGVLKLVSSPQVFHGLITRAYGAAERT